jgi:hypothetical protein
MILGTEYSVELVDRPDMIFIAASNQNMQAVYRQSDDYGYAPCDWHQVVSKPLCCPTRAGQFQAICAMGIDIQETLMEHPHNRRF